MNERFLLRGPDRHGVVRHSSRLAAAAGTPLARSVAELPVGAVVHLDLTDRLLAADSGGAQREAALLFDALAERRARVVLGLHDIPDGSGSAWSTRRRGLYHYLAGRAQVVVTSTDVEADLLRALDARCDAVLPLPVAPGTRAVAGHIRSGASGDPVAAGAAGANAGADDPTTVTVLGFVWPGRGHDEVLAALPDGLELCCLGGPAEGHEALAAALAADPRVRTTGYVAATELPDLLRARTLPVAPNRALAASASICEWWAYGRRPLVPDTRHTQELLRRNPGSLILYGDLGAALTAARLDPASTYLPPEVRPGPELAVAAADRLAVGR